MNSKAKSKYQLKPAQLRGRKTDPGALAEIQDLLVDCPRRKDLLIEFFSEIIDQGF